MPEKGKTKPLGVAFKRRGRRLEKILFLQVYTGNLQFKQGLQNKQTSERQSSGGGGEGGNN